MTRSERATFRTTRATPGVAITGLGALTPIGRGVSTTWAAALRGVSGVGELPEDWADELPVHIAARVPADFGEALSRPEHRHLDRSGQLALIAGREAWADAGYQGAAGGDCALDPRRVATVFGCGMGGLGTTLDQFEALGAKGARSVNPYSVTMLMPNAPAAVLGIETGARAGVHAVVSACASGAESVSRAAELIRLGHADVVLAGGSEAIVRPLAIAGFAAMRALSTRNGEPERASRPFDRDRDGFVMGEGAAALVLESTEHARARGARVYCELAGSATTADSHHIAQPHPDGGELSQAIDLSLERSGLAPADVVHINAHATSTPTGDLAESRALRRGLGSALDGAAVSATKSMTGHLIAAAGAVEAAFAALALHHRTAPPSINLDNQDPAIELDVVRDEPRPLPDGPIAALSTSLGFGGHNVALAFRSV
ncbi:beta-ketoacyl-[acyl-carrier-protein] synthase family protein [Streptomyces sp. NPDC087300]|uniref:beta-ketoacyl-[acyl-carrier-protein] synthase family protein n=1 Tax=Streptomyces sp. NPDC087300 TaxID=3365780 RepID=UPI00382CFE09